MNERSRTVPVFSTESEEAEWWYAQRDQITEDFEQAFHAGQLTPRRLMPADQISDAPSDEVTIRLPERDLARARDLAAKLGVGYQTYLKLLLQRAIEAEERRLAG